MGSIPAVFQCSSVHFTHNLFHVCKCVNSAQEPHHCGLPRSPETSFNAHFDQYKVPLELYLFFVLLSLMNVREELAMGILGWMGKGR